MMDTEEIKAVLDERRQSFEACDSADALNEPVDTSKFYRFVASIDDIRVMDDEVQVRFYEPVPGGTSLDPGYIYTISVAREFISDRSSRCQMPRDDLITLQQVGIVIWAMAMGLLGEPE